MKVILSVVLGLVLGNTPLHAQQSLSASGGNAMGTGGSASYTLGQVVYTTTVGADGSVAQGVQQSYTISTVTALEESRGITLHCSAYPNPATDYVTVEVEDFNTKNLTYLLYDVSGKLLTSKKADGNETRIDMGDLNAAIYFLRVIDPSRELKTFKIIKSN